MLITAILLLIKVGIVTSRPDAYLLNKAVVVGQRMELQCKANQNETVNRWTATRVGQKFEVIFHSELQTNSSVKERDNAIINSNFPYFGVQFRQNGDCILYSNRTELNDAGVYACLKNNDAIQYTAKLTVLESNPVCESNIASGNDDISLSSDVIIWIQCSLNFSTVDNYPSMEWIQHHEDTQLIRNDSISITTNTTVTSVLSVSINSTENGSYFSCSTFFKQYNGPIKTTASNIPDFRFIWNSTKVVFQENTFSTDKDLDAKDILMSSDSQMATTVTNALIDRIGTDSSSNYWFFVSLSLVAVVSIFFVLAIMALNFYICRKRITTGGGDPVHASSFTSLDHPMSDEYEIMPYAYTDGYDKIEDNNVTDLDVPIQFPRREGPLPTPGYDHLLSQTRVPTVYSPIDNYEQPIDREDIELSPGLMPESKQYLDIDKSVANEHSVKVNVKLPAYIQLISETEEEDSSTVSLLRKGINRSSESPDEIPSSYLKINEDITEFVREDVTEDGFDTEGIPSSYLKISEDVIQEEIFSSSQKPRIDVKQDINSGEILSQYIS